MAPSSLRLPAFVGRVLDALAAAVPSVALVRTPNGRGLAVGRCWVAWGVGVGPANNLTEVAS
jgi:hypothetical protein